MLRLCGQGWHYVQSRISDALSPVWAAGVARNMGSIRGLAADLTNRSRRIWTPSRGAATARRRERKRSTSPLAEQPFG
eukprot:3151726-Pyramimonas_sp.AAC.1